MRHADQGTFTRELWDELAALGYVGMTIPEEYGGMGLGMFEMMLVMEEMSSRGIPLLMLVVGPGLSILPLVKYGSDEQKQRFLPAAASGEKLFCFAITEPNAGTNTFRIETFAKKDGSGWRLNGQKVFISGVDVADYMLVVARTRPYNPEKRSDGISLFIVDTKAEGVTIQPIETQIAAPEKQFAVFFENVFVDEQNLLGEEGKGTAYLFDGLNPERIMIAAMAVGLGRYALSKAVDYANVRKVFNVPIGAHQGLQHPMALAKTHLECAALMNRQAAWMYDNGLNAGPYANMAKLAAADAALEACDIGIQVHGGNGLSKEYDMMNLWSLCRLLKVAPISREMILNYIGEHVLQLPKSY